MATAKIATLIIRTLAKPISARIKDQARQHERFRSLCVDLAQFMYRSEVRLRTNILGEPARHIRPLSETKAIDNGANALAEGFLFSVAAGLILGEAWRSSRKDARRREGVDDQLETLAEQVKVLSDRVDDLVQRSEEEAMEERLRNDELTRILERVVEIGLRGGWAEFQDAPLQLPLIRLTPRLHSRKPLNPTPSVLSSIPDTSETFGNSSYVPPRLEDIIRDGPSKIKLSSSRHKDL